MAEMKNDKYSARITNNILTFGARCCDYGKVINRGAGNFGSTPGGTRQRMKTNAPAARSRRPQTAASEMLDFPVPRRPLNPVRVTSLIVGTAVLAVRPDRSRRFCQCSRPRMEGRPMTLTAFVGRHSRLRHRFSRWIRKQPVPQTVSGCTTQSLRRAFLSSRSKDIVAHACFLRFFGMTLGPMPMSLCVPDDT